MAGTNDFKAVATGVGANVITQSAFAALTSFLANGYSSGVVASNQFNKVLRQSSFISAVIGQIVANAEINAVDDGDVAGFVTDLITALTAAFPSASATVQGKVELATEAETLAATDTARAVTPADLATVIPAVPRGSISNVTASRALASTYTNSTGYAIIVMVYLTVNNGQSASFYIGGNVVQAVGNAATTNTSKAFCMYVPNGATYQVTCSGGTLTAWNEIR